MSKLDKEIRKIRERRINHLKSLKTIHETDRSCNYDKHTGHILCKAKNTCPMIHKDKPLRKEYDPIIYERDTLVKCNNRLCSNYNENGFYIMDYRLFQHLKTNVYKEHPDKIGKPIKHCSHGVPHHFNDSCIVKCLKHESQSCKKIME